MHAHTALLSFSSIASGNVFLDLLKSAMLEDASFIQSTPNTSHIPSGMYSLRSRTGATTQKPKILCLLKSCYCEPSSSFTLRSFMGLDSPELIVRKAHRKVQNPWDPFEAQHTAELVDAMSQAATVVWETEAKEGWGHPADGSQTFRRCQQCFDTMERQVLYFSRACQVADWKLRHKAACGTPLGFDAVFQLIVHPISLPNSETRIGLPVNGYKRSLALVAQNVDFGAGSHLQVVLRASRKIAMTMTTGDRACIAGMAHLLCAVFMSSDPADADAITPSMIVEQFTREHVFDGLREAVLEMQELQDWDPLKRPPLLANAPPNIWAGILQVSE
ncbi:hypothetical protein B0H17DRAFT_1217514 [Mycena rosella]|uniref:MYND-type domain-containing protein n=1 Tax=Mycena rosella TaxID=1033263 RepID=A0AAD7BXY7_MYCRO|nr:hypothetical protein B0H17DRAFT_1217514 [Mycena rosella]